MNNEAPDEYLVVHIIQTKKYSIFLM